jgi:hypothetical protein
VLRRKFPKRATFSNIDRLVFAAQIKVCPTRMLEIVDFEHPHDD